MPSAFYRQNIISKRFQKAFTPAELCNNFDCFMADCEDDFVAAVNSKNMNLCNRDFLHSDFIDEHSKSKKSPQNLMHKK